MFKFFFILYFMLNLNFAGNKNYYKPKIKTEQLIPIFPNFDNEIIHSNAVEEICQSIQSANRDESIYIASLSLTGENNKIIETLSKKMYTNKIYIIINNPGKYEDNIINFTNKQVKMFDSLDHDNVFIFFCRGRKADNYYNFSKIQNNRYIIIGNHTLFTGSLNYSSSSSKNLNNLLKIKHSKIINDYKKNFSKLIEHAYKYTKTFYENAKENYQTLINQNVDNFFSVDQKIFIDVISNILNIKINYTSNINYTVAFRNQGKIVDKIIEHIKKAKERILIQMTYFTNSKILDAIILQKEKFYKLNVYMILGKHYYGCNGSILTNYTHLFNIFIYNEQKNKKQNKKSNEKFDEGVYEDQESEGNNNMENNEESDKIMIIDGEYVMIGSANFTISAALYNQENLLFIHSPELANLYAENFIEIINLKNNISKLN